MSDDDAPKEAKESYEHFLEQQKEIKKYRLTVPRIRGGCLYHSKLKSVYVSNIFVGDIGAFIFAPFPLG